MTFYGLGEIFVGNSADICSDGGAERRVLGAQTRVQGPHRCEGKITLCFNLAMNVLNNVP